MHIPDGMLSTPVALITGGGALASLTYAFSWVKRYLPERKVVLMATLGALIFALQMLNFPVAVGTSGHFSGGALAAVTLGFWPAQIVMTTILAIQALLFNDGGIVAFGANVFNMAIIAPTVGYGCYRLAIQIKDSRTARLIGAGIGAWLAAVISAVVAGLQIGLSGNANLIVVTTAMASWHAVIGIGEALITVALLSYLFAVRPDLVENTLQHNAPATATAATLSATDNTAPPAPTAAAAAESPPTRFRLSTRATLLSLAALAALLAAFSWLASDHPDGLEYVYFETGIGKAFHNPEWFSRLPTADYAIRGVTNEQLGTVLAGIIGLTLVGTFLWLLLKPRKP